MSKKWTLEKIKEAFEKFKHKNGRLPTTADMKDNKRLPSARWLQKGFGGVPEVREMLGYEETDFGSGKNRSEIAAKSITRGKDAEVKLELYLRGKFGDIYVHNERIYDYSDLKRIDFYVYTPKENIGIDVFHTGTLRDLQTNVSIKLNKYEGFEDKLYFACANSDCNQGQFHSYIQSKRKPMPENTHLVTMAKLKTGLEKYPRYEDPRENGGPANKFRNT